MLICLRIAGSFSEVNMQVETKVKSGTLDLEECCIRLTREETEAYQAEQSPERGFRAFVQDIAEAMRGFGNVDVIIFGYDGDSVGGAYL
jgi:hypothetical protein